VQVEKTREVAEGGDPNASTSRTRIGIAVPAPRVQAPRPEVGESGGNGRSQTKITVMLGRHSAGRHAAAIRLEPGQQVPSTPYRIVRWLGDGGMGVVYEAEHVALERRVALKVLRPEATGSVAETRMFRQEARTVSKIGSEHIVEVFDLGELPDGRVWFAMELLGGTSLELLAKEEPFEPSRAIAILRQVCKGLAAAHATGVVHRDVKPGNISVQTRRGRADAVKILDFGVSALLSEVAQGGVVLAGTPAYMAPELACGLPYDARVDLYALGCTAYEMFAGHPPFVGSDVDEVLLAHVEREPTPIAEASRVPIPPPLAAVIMRCLAKHADDRYADAADVEAALCEAQVEAGIRTSWDDLELPEVDPKRREALLRRMPEPGRTEAPKKRRVMAFLLAALVASSFVLGAMLWPDRRSTPEDLDLIERLTIAARASAAKSWFVYPPASSPDERTAFRTIVELESVEGDAAAEAQARAALLREEFSTTLMRLGDRYWEREGGRAFAVDYYAAALIFDPTLEAARERVSLTPGELADLREKAQSQSFSPAELRATDALAALAEEDPEERRRKLEALENDEERSAVSGTRLAQLIAEDTGPKTQSRPKRSRDREPALDGASSRVDPQDAKEESVDPRQGEQDVAPTDRAADLPATSKRDPEAARALVEQGDAALKRGNVSEARRFYERALAADARHAPAFYGLSRESFHAGDYAEAARLGEKAVRARPNASEYRIHLGDAYYKAFRYADAQREYAKAKELGHAAAAGRLAKVQGKAGG
jgi:serine/threonine protein kinase/tetratricopeptide (TPR) repeat protein